MPTLEELSKQCISVCQVPVDVSPGFIIEYVKRQFQGGGIVDTDKVDGIESGNHLTRLVLLCAALEDVDHMCEEVKEEEIDFEGKRFTVKYQTSVACELPERWEDLQIPEQDRSKQHTGGPEPPKRQQILGAGHPNSQQYAWPPGPYGAVSGFYQNIPGSEIPNMNQGGMQGHFPGQQPMPGNEQQQGHGPQQGHAPHGPQQGHAPHPGQGHDPQRGQGHGQGMNFPFGPGGTGQMPPGFPPGYPMFPMPPPDQNNPQGGHNMQFMPRIPMMFDQRSGQWFPAPGFPGMQQPPESHRHSPGNQRGPPPPYNGQQSTEVKSPRGGHNDGEGSRAVADQDLEYEKIQAKLNREQQSMNYEEEEPADPEPENREPSEPETPEENQTKIVVSNLPSTAHDEYLQMFFENKRKFKGCDVYSVEMDEDGTSAIIEFETPEAVDIVLSKCPLKMMGREVEISKFEPPPPVLLCTVEVTGPCSVVSEDHLEMLEMYFENSKRSGGGDVVDIEFDTVNNMVLVTFDSEDVAQKVAEKGRHVIKNEKLNVKVHIPSKKSKKPDDVEEEKQEEEEEETKPSNTIKVKGINKSASRDTVEFYFENNRRSGGGEIETIKSDDEDEDVLYITFKSTEVAESVSERTHKLEGKSLNVSLYVPPVAPPSYDNKILLKGLQASTTQDCLFNFIEAKSGCLPETMDYHSEQEDVAMVTFSEIPDFKKLESAFDKYKLEGASLKICPVPISNCIIVANLASEVTKDTIEFYFENKRKSGGGQVDKVVMNEDDTCLVYFADYTVIDDVLEKEHTLSKQLLDVKRYQECLGRPEGEVAERVLRLPEDHVLKNVDAQKLKFLKHSNANRMAIQTQLDSCYATIVWPEEGGEVILKCTLTNEVKDCFKIIKTWKNTAEKNFEDFMKLIIVKKVQILQDIWGKVMEELQKFNIENPEAVAIFVDKNEGVITVAGNKKVAEDLSTKIENMTKVVMAEVEKEREKIKETITTLKNIETRMLLADKFPTDVEKQFPDLKVKINQNKNEIVFEGPLGQVRDAKLKMYELKTRFAVDRSEKISELAAGLLILKQTKEHVVKKLKASRVTAVWDTVDGYLEVYCTSQDQIQLCVNVIRSCIIEHTVALKKAAKTVVNSEKWQTKVDELHGYHAGKCFIKVSDDSCKVQICATDDIANEILDNVKIFLRQNTVVEAKVPCTKNVHRLIERHHKNEISNIAKGLTNYNVQISSVAEYGGFEVCGTEDGLHQALQQLQQLLLKVKQKEHIMTKPGLSKHMQTPKGKDNLNTIESMHQCVVAVKGDYDEDEINDNPYESVPIVSDVRVNIGVKGVKIVAYSKVYDCRNVYTMQGDMTELTVDMIVNSADDKLSLTGGLGNAIVKKGGKNIQKECAAYIRDNDRLDDGDAFVSTAGSLKADAIVHVRGPVWRGGMKQEDEMLNEAIFKCLQQASTRNLTSVAMPALSCGTYGYPVRKATAVIVAAVKNFFREVQESTVTDIYLCDMKSNTVEAFNEAMSNEFGATNVKKYVNNLDSIRQPSKRFSRADSDDEKPYIKPMDTDEEDDDYYQSSSNLAPPSGKAPPLPKGRPPQKTTKIGNISVSVVKGEIAKQKVDVIVNTTAKNLDLKNGAVSASLLKTGGMELQQEVSKKYPNGIKDGEIAVTSGQSLRCDIVVHSSLANWDGKKDAQCKQALHKLMKDCMDEAENQGKTSIAFPAIGTGNLGFPRDIVATEMFSAVSKFSNSNPSSSLREVSFIVYQKDFQTIQAFENEARRWSTGKMGATGGREGRQYDLYQDLQDDGSDSDSDTFGNGYDTMEHNRKTRREKRKEADYVTPYTGLQRICDPKYWLEDENIDMASKIIKNTNSDISGLEQVCVISAGQAKKCSGEYLQILHSHGHHWITATTIGCDTNVIKVYDSMYRDFDRHCLKQIIKMSPVDETGEIIVELAQFQRQRNKADCGLFAIAAAFSLAGRQNPSNDRYDLEKMRLHLLSCIQAKALIPFPDYPGTVTSQKKKVYNVAVCCHCGDLLNRAGGQTVLQCQSCARFCHTPRDNSLNSCSMKYNDMDLCVSCYTQIYS